MYIKKCLICNREFKTSHKETQTCSKSCAARWRYKKSKDENEAKVIKHINLKHPDIRYVSGYKPHHPGKQKNTRLLLKCVKWDIRFYAYESAVRKKNWKCYVCSHHSHAKIYEDDIKKWNEMVSAKPVIFKQCKWCGKIFVTNSYRRSYCSSHCGRKAADKIETEKKRRRFERAKSNGKYELISLERLYERDKGVCYLCGKHLMLNDDYNRDEAPTIEHIIPICNGGTNTWDNVKLACRKCNVEKGTLSLNKFLIEKNNLLLSE